MPTPAKVVKRTPILRPPVSGRRTLPDGAELVFIPAGEFTMGSNDYADEKPVHKVYLDSYYIAKTPVTVKQYLAFCAATGHAKSSAPDFNANWSKEAHPIVNVSWNDAVAYCAWVSRESGLKVSLPTEAQWEKAARGKDGRKFPWGNTFDGSRLQHSTAKLGDAGGTAAVGSFPDGASSYGVLAMAGNVFQWCADYYGETYYASSPKTNPPGSGSGSARVLRGGSWDGDDEGDFRCAFRGGDAPDLRATGIGFRCVVSADSSSLFGIARVRFITMDRNAHGESLRT